MSTSSHADFNVFFSETNTSLYLCSILMAGNCNFLKVVKISYMKSGFFVIFRYFFSTYEFFVGRAWSCPVGTFEKECSRKKMSSKACLKKSSFNFFQITFSFHFSPSMSSLEVDFCNIQAKLKNNHWNILRGGVAIIVLNFELPVSSGLRGKVAVLRVDCFKNPWFYLVVI